MCGRAAQVLVLGALLSGCAHAPLTPKADVAAYARAAQDSLNRNLGPKLTGALPLADRNRLGTLRATVVDAGDPLETRVRSSGANSSFVLSSAFLALQRELIDASVLSGATTGYEAQLADYAVEVSRHAVKVHRGEPAPTPAPFWQYVGWTRERYEAFRADVRYEALGQRATDQSLAWLLATAVSEHLDPDTAASGTLDFNVQSQRIRTRAAQLMLQARWAPVPAWPVAILFAATRAPQEQASAQWLCSARAALKAAAQQTSGHGFAAEDQASAPEVREAVLARWRETSRLLAERGSCDQSNP